VNGLSAIARPDKRYLVVLGACLTQFTVIGLLFSYGLFFKAFEAEFGWSRTLLSSGLSFAFIVMGVLAFFGGHLSDRYGPRLVLAVAGTLCGMGYGLLSQVTQPWQLFAIFGLFFGVGLATHDVVTLSTIARQFRQRRGIMTGVVKVGTAAGQVAIPPSAAFLIAIYDWRLAAMILGAAAVALLLVAASLMKGPAASAGPGDGTGATGYRYFTMIVDNLDEIAEECRQAGVPVLAGPTEIRPGVRIVMVADPDGNWVEFVDTGA